jgi:uracil-DNA glycosylase
MSQIKIDPSWKAHLENQFQLPYMQKLKNFLNERKSKGAQIFPSGSKIFAAFDATPFENVKVVILGQDPYHGPGQAHGLSFSVPKGVAFPPSLQNILKERKQDIGAAMPECGDLTPWAKQGVLLLNSVLTVESGAPASHQGQGWEMFTTEVIKLLNDKKEGLVFILWGSYAQKKAEFLDSKRHFVHRSVHPSPLSAHRGFFGSRPFSQANEYLKSVGKSPIDWAL